MDPYDPQKSEEPEAPAGDGAQPGTLGPATGPVAVVGIGASAGGLEAFGRLLSNLPDDSGMAFVLVQHLDPRHESKLRELLAKTSRIPVVEATEGLVLRPDHVYVIPPDTSLTLAQGFLHLAPRGGARAPFLPIDTFFKSLAADRQAGAIGVILSGTGSDGTLGVEEIKAAGGFTFAQDEASAKYPGMPQSAVRSGSIDLILSPDEIARELGRIGRHAYVAPIDTAHETLPAAVEGPFKKILALLRSVAGVDFSAYRETTLRRRIMRRAVLHTKENLGEYAELLERDPGEVQALYHDILISVTSFFRDPETFEALKHAVFPAILRSAANPLRIWVAGCSTGQEAYSLAMALLEFLEGKTARPAIQIFATDLSDAVSLKRARDGVYPKNIEAEVSPERLRRFFTKEDDHYRISKFIRELCVFARQNVAADPPFSRVDLISCRNLLIYLGAPLQKRVIPTFHYALNPAGYLLLGQAETIGGFTDLFGVVDHRHRIYVKKLTAARPYPHFNATAYQGATSTQPVVPATTLAADWQREADRVALGQYAPPGVLVNADLDVLQFRGRTGPYLEPAPGEPSFNLLSMAREGLPNEIRKAVDACREQRAPVRREGLQVCNDAGVREVDLRVLPVNPPAGREQCFLVLFEENRFAEGYGRPSSPLESGDLRNPTSTGEEVRLGQELASTREHLQAMRQQHAAAEEELKSANEEILSSNEELQSTNEELQAAKEELQSLNEELTTVNEQLQHRNQELTRLSDDLANLFGSASVPMVLLDIDLRVRQFTPAAAKVMNLAPGDMGRPLRNITLPFETPNLESVVTEVISTLRVEERELRDRGGRWYALRVHPYRTGANKIDGAVVVLADVHEAKTAGLRAQEALDYARAIVETVRDPLVVLDASLRVRSANRAFYETFKIAPEQAANQPFYDLGDRGWDIPELRTLLEDVLARRTALENYEVAHAFGPLGPKVMLLNARRVVPAGEGAELILLAIEDVTDRKRADEVLREAHDLLEERVKERTAELARVNEALEAEVAGHRHADADRLDLLRRLAGAQEEERHRLARELHDQMGQHLAALGLGLKSLKDATPDHSPAHEGLQRLQELADLMGREVHQIALKLRPTALDDLGLQTALGNYAEAWSGQTGIEMDFQSTGQEGPRLTPLLETTLYRVVQEALTNVSKHAVARRVSLILHRTPQEVLAIVEDDGRGFDVEAPCALGRLGLLGMRERLALAGGTLTVESSPGKGTTVFARIPLPPVGGGNDG